VNISEGGQTAPTSLTYGTLNGLIAQGSLITGARYLITDF
jgi:hypothetical protein